MMRDVMDTLSDDLRELHVVLDDMKDYQRRQSSLRWNFWRGVFYGFGFFIGSAILATLLIYLLNSINVDGSTVIGKFFKSIIEIVRQIR